jgi:hypothetical protein
MKVWITKYALSSGIIVAENAKLCANSTAVSYTTGDSSYPQYAHSKDWHRSRVDAILRAEEMRRKKITSLTKQIEKLRRLDFYREAP